MKGAQCEAGSPLQGQSAALTHAPLTATRQALSSHLQPQRLHQPEPGTRTCGISLPSASLPSKSSMLFRSGTASPPDTITTGGTGAVRRKAGSAGKAGEGGKASPSPLRRAGGQSGALLAWCKGARQ